MRIIDEKNLAFSDQPPPLLAKAAAETIKSHKATAQCIDELELNFPLLHGTYKEADLKADKKSGMLKVRLKEAQFGEHVFPANIKVEAIKTLGNKSANFSKALIQEGFVPKHLNFSVNPEKIERIERMKLKSGVQATTIFPPDNRYSFFDTHYPWSCCGRVSSPLGTGSGVMIGPRHLLTCSHVIQWLPDNHAGWVKFTPMYYNGSEPFGHAWGTMIYSKYKVSGPTIDWIEGMYDYVVVVLDWYIGNRTGWLGSKGYTDSWDGGQYWAHVGYPGDLTGTNRPTFQNGIALDGLWWEFDSHETMNHYADVWPGQSGGPFFGWWSGESWPSAVAVQSGQNPSENTASGGQDMVDLVIHARSDYP